MRVAAAFERARAERRRVLVGYLPAGYPSYDGCVAALASMVENGVDVVEVGLPYSDPVMDGPTIQQAAEQALRGGTRTRDVLRTVEAVASSGVPALCMTYWNPIARYGVDRFAADLASAGGAGLITPDLIPEEAADWVTASDTHDLDRVFLVAPSSTDDRIKSTVDACRGFVYAASLMGVTGARDTVDAQGAALVDRVRPVTDLPVGVGLGVSNGDQAASVAAYADAVIVGSAFVRRLLDASSEDDGARSVGELAADLADGVRRA
ncbi:MAG: tryptophan synthase subunit alpha [Streptosporangiales bacterium]|nr:tryptophan synthase subunit alpha [Streptosporangiales bacterium]